MPKEYTYEEAATLPCSGLTAWRALIEECDIQTGNSLLIEGTGGTSIFALLLAKSKGADVYAITSSDEKAQKLKELGVKEVVNYKNDPEWGKRIYEMSGHGIDHVLDMGGPGTFQQSVAAVKVGGNIISIGVLVRWSDW